MDEYASQTHDMEVANINSVRFTHHSKNSSNHLLNIDVPTSTRCLEETPKQEEAP